MPSLITHLTIAKRYLEKHPETIRDRQAFIDGNVLPDLTPNKEVSHCGLRMEKHDIVKRNAEKVNPAKFAATHDLDDDLNKGQYLHLLVDYQYYNVFLLDYYARPDTEWAQASIDMYEAIHRDDVHLREKYGTEYTDSTLSGQMLKLIGDWNDKRADRSQRPGYHFDIPYDLDALDAFIERLSDTVIQ